MSANSPEETTLQGPVNLTLHLQNSKAQNPDGRRESTSLNVKGNSLRFALVVLRSINREKGATLTTRILNHCQTQLGIAEDSKNNKANSKLIQREFKAKTTPFRSFTFSVAGEENKEITFTITAPSYIACISSFVVLTEPQRIGELISTLNFFENYDDNWDDEEEEDDYNESWDDYFDAREHEDTPSGQKQ